MESHFKADLALVIERAALAGVLKLINVACHLQGSRESDRMCRKDFLKTLFGDNTLHNDYGEKNVLPEIFGAQGIHPHDSDQTTDEVMTEFLRAIRENSRIVVIGETGLDYFYMHQSKEVQMASLRKHLELARETGLPISIHCRDSADSREARTTILEVLREFSGVRCVMHCFSQDTEYADSVLAMPAGHILSFSGTVTYKGSDEIRRVAARVPHDRIVVETDCPYLAPQVFRGKRNEPAFVAETAKVLAELRGMSRGEFEVGTSRTAERFFGI